MKKGLKIAASMLMVISMLAGCGTGDKTKTDEGVAPGTANAQLFDNMKKGETIDAADVTAAFNDALEKSEAAGSATIDTEVSINLTENGESSSSKSITQIKYQPVGVNSNSNNEAAEDKKESEAEGKDSKDKDAAEQSTESKAEAEQSTAKIASVKVTNEYNGESNTIEGYFEDNYLYYTLEDKQVKEAMTYDGLMSMVGSYALNFTEDVVEDALKVTSDDEIKYTIKFNQTAMADMMTSNMAGAGSPLGDGEEMVINEAYMYFVVDNDGCLTGFDMELDAKFSLKASEAGTQPQSGEDTASSDSVTESPFKYSVAANFSDLESTVVEKPEKLEGYRDVNEVLEEIQQQADEEAAEAATDGDAEGESKAAE